MEDTHKVFNITQAGNYLKELKNKLVAKIKGAVSKEAKISTALPQDRRKFLAYAISLLDNVSRENLHLFCKVTGKSLNVYSCTELAGLYKQLLTLRVSGYSIRQIAYILKTPPEILGKVELIALAAVDEAIEKKKVGAVPILNG